MLDRKTAVVLADIVPTFPPPDNEAEPAGALFLFIPRERHAGLHPQAHSVDSGACIILESVCEGLALVNSNWTLGFSTGLNSREGGALQIGTLVKHGIKGWYNSMERR